MNKKVFAFVWAFTVLLLLSASVNAASYFTGNLNFAQEPGPPPVPSTATGFGRVTLNDAETQITVSVYYTGLTNGVTVGHIHGPAAPGANAGVLFDLAPTAGQTTGNVRNLTFSITPTQLAQLKAGLFYFNIHTGNNPNGEIRGQILVDSPFLSYMSPKQEPSVNPATPAAAVGAGAVSINEATNQAIVTMNWSGLSGNANVGHVHNGRSGTNGPVICDLVPAGGLPATSSVVDALCTFTPAQITLLKQGQFYLNVHTTLNTGGEVRGQIQRRRSTVVDFDGDSKTDFAIARNNTGTNQIEWWINLSSGGVSAFPFGVSAEFNSARIVAGDFDGDGKDDATIWRSAATPNAGFLILQSSNSTVRFEQFGTTGDDPRVIYDYDGDGRCDIAVFRTSDDTWYYLGSAGNPNRNITFVRWGTTFPNPGDFDGDGRGDFMDQQGANWWILNSRDLSVRVQPFGTSSFFGTPGDYDGDGKTDVAGSINEAPDLAWYYVSSLNPTQNVFLTRRAWGPSAPLRVRTQGDYDGDGRSDYAVWIEGTSPAFWVLPSNGSTPIVISWGIAGTPDDFPVAGYNNR